MSPNPNPVSFVRPIRRSGRARDVAAIVNSIFGWRRHPRNGKVARLPEATRDQINRMIEDGVPYRAILDKLQDSSAAPLPYPISEMNISNWVRGGYQEWRRQQDSEILASFPSQHGAAASEPSEQTEPNRAKPKQTEPIKG